MYAKIPGYVYQKNNKKLRFYHHVNVDSEFRQDCQTWLGFLDQAQQQRQLLCQPFINLSLQVCASELNFYSDATKNLELGFGAIFNNSWTFGQWEPGYIDQFDPSIEYLELFAVCIGIFTWGHHITNTRVVIFCDNMSVVHIINNSSSTCKNCMHLIHLLVGNCLEYNRWIFARHVRGCDNNLSDALSSQDLACFWHLAPSTTNRYPDALPKVLWPASHIWKA